MSLDQDPVIALADLVGRSGGRELQIGYLDDDVPVDQARWYAQALFRGARLIADDYPSLVEACDALARRILAGAQCTHCKRTVTLNDTDDGCRWRRMGDRWTMGCKEA